MKPIYLDYAAATPIDQAIEKEMQKYTEISANPSSIHTKGQEAKAIINKSKQSIATILNCNHEEIIFTSGGTESNNLALQGLINNLLSNNNHNKNHNKTKQLQTITIITTPIEHQSILKTIEAIKKTNKNKIKTIYLKVNKQGKINLQELEKTITRNCIISIGSVNNELGTVQEIKAIGAIIKRKKKELKTNNIFFHTDACQAEFESLNVQDLNVDLLTLNSSKIYGPKGIGLLYKKKSVQLQPILFGGEQEYSLRAGTENTIAIAGFAKALEINEKTKKKEKKRILLLYHSFQTKMKTIKNITINSQPSHIISITIADCDSHILLQYLDQEQIYASAGSACTAGNNKPSHVLKAIGLSDEQANQTIRISFGRYTTKKELGIVIQKLRTMIESLRKLNKEQKR